MSALRGKDIQIVGIIIQARLGSTRLPAKVMLMLPTGRCVLDEVIHQCEHSKLADKVILATPDKDLKYDNTYIGSEDDVYSRYIEASEKFNIDTIVRITSDCPLISPKIIDEAIFQFKSSGLEFIYNSDEDGGDGFDVEVFKLETLIRYGKDKEHVTGNMRKHATKLRIPSPKRDGKSIDTMKDYLEVCEILK